jgi:protein phosphatase
MPDSVINPHENDPQAQGREVSFPNVHGPFDIVGDVHGCLDELLELMGALGYRIRQQAQEFTVTQPEGRTLAFVGDLVDRGPSIPEVLRLAMSMARAGQAVLVPGNRDAELVQALKGHVVQITYGMAQSLGQLAEEPKEFCDQALRFLEGLPSHCVFDEGRLVIAHAGLREPLQGKTSAEAREFALHGQTTGKRDELGRLIRYNWAAEYRGKALVVFGHTPVVKPLWMNNTVDIDTGCVYGGHLTALRYPERETVSVPAKAIYSKTRRQFQVNERLTPKAGKAVGR